MWKWIHKDKTRPEPPGVGSGWPTATALEVGLLLQEPVQKIQAAQLADDFQPDVTHLGKSIVIKGEVSGSGNIHWDGELEGTIELPGSDLTVGPNGRIRANLRARNIVVEGRVNGNLHGVERVELKKSAVLVGDILTQRVAIEDGALLKGSVLVQRESSQTKKEDKNLLANA